MNIKPSNPAALERALAEVLRNLLSDVTWLHGWSVRQEEGAGRRWDLRASGPLPGGGKASLCIECKLHFQPSQFHSVVDRQCQSVKGTTTSRVLAMPHVSTRMAALCQENDWSWFDLAGNCRLNVPGAILIERSGNERVRVGRSTGANLGTPEAGRVVRALLATDNAGQRWTQRGIVAHFEEMATSIEAPSLALVNKVVQHLQKQAFIEPLKNRGFRVSDYEGLLRAWNEVYRFERHSRRRYFTLLEGHSLHEKLRSLDPDGHGRVAYAAFSAADFQAANVRQARTWLYVAPTFEDEFQSAMNSKPVDSGENLVVLIPDDAGVFYRVEAANNRLPCTNAIQTYVDLTHAGNRGDEAAEAVLEQRLKPAWAPTSNE